MRKAILVSLANILALFIAAYLLHGVHISNTATLVWAGVFLGLVNLLLRPILLLLTLPINVLTLGLFTLVVNTWMIMLTGFFTPGLSIHGFGTAFLTSLIVTVCNWVTRDAYRKKDHF